MKKVGIVDFGMGNINSICNALKFIGSEFTIVLKPDDLNNLTHIILPGVGSFKKAMTNLSSLDLVEKIRNSVLSEKKKILGICRGMQLLGSSSTEDGYTEGLSLINNKVRIFSSKETMQKNIPHIGFNTIKIFNNRTFFFNKIDDNSNFYFIHSYRMLREELIDNYALCNYGSDFLAAFNYNNIFGTQFHPEKSQSNGLQLIYNFLVS